MTSSTRQPAFPTARVLIVLSGLAAVLTASASGIAAGCGADRPQQMGIVFAAVSVWLAALGGTLLIHVVEPLGATATIGAYLAGTAGRLLFCLAAALVGVYIMRLPAEATLLTMGGIYLPLLFVEAGFVGRYLWRKDSLPGAEASEVGKVTA